MKTTIVCGILSSAFLANIIWIYEPGTSLFSWHPTFMIAGQVLTIQGIALFGRLNTKWRLTVHWILAGFGFIAFLLGFLAIYINKNNYSKPHFVSWHGIAGLSTMLILTGQTLGGVLAKYRVSFGSFVDNKLLKKAHRLNGILTIFVSVLTVNLVVQFPSALWLTYFCTVLVPLLVLSYRILPKLFGLTKKQQKLKG